MQVARGFSTTVEARGGEDQLNPKKFENSPKYDIINLREATSNKSSWLSKKMRYVTDLHEDQKRR